MSNMNPEVKKKWLSALRSGKYRQCRAWLRNDVGYCCLGVLCDLHRQEVGAAWQHDKASPVYNYLGFAGLTPDEVRTWANMSYFMTTCLSGMNDTDHTFEQIADFIEAKY